jgi:hypothetical protein
MQLLQNISLEYRIGLIFGVTALLFTLLIGIISGIQFDVIAIRLLIMAPVYALIGTGIVITIKKFVPEFYELFNRSSGSDDSGTENLETSDTDSVSDSIAEEEGGISGAGDEEAVPEESEFNEMNTDELPRVETGENTDLDTSLDNPVDASQGKMGRHIVATEKVAKYEPKVMAEAVRTMMSKDED